MTTKDDDFTVEAAIENILYVTPLIKEMSKMQPLENHALDLFAITLRHALKCVYDQMDRNTREGKK